MDGVNGAWTKGRPMSSADGSIGPERFRSVSIRGKMVTDGKEWFIKTEDVVGDEPFVLSTDDGTRYLWAAVAEVARFDVVNAAYEYIGQEHHEDAWEWVDEGKVSEAQRLIDEALSKVITYWQDETLAILIGPSTGVSSGGEHEI